MTTSAVTFDEVVELASHLSPEERLRLVAQIETDLSAAAGGAASGEAPPGSAKAILLAMRGSPHLSAEDVDDLEQAIAGGKLPVGQKGLFDSRVAK
jgi:hypothetical protein